MSKLESRVLSALGRQKKVPIALRELAKQAGVNKAEKGDFVTFLDSLKNQHRLIERDSGKLLLADNLGLVPATIVKVNATFGFARPDDGERDIFVPGRMLMGSMPGDAVLIRLNSRSTGELPEGEVYKVINQQTQKFSGVLTVNEQECFVTPDRYVKFPVTVSRKTVGNARSGDKILAEVAQRGRRHSEHKARLVESFGSATSAAACCRSVLAANDISIPFPDEVLEQARAITAGEGIHAKELAGRMDLREACLFTIDSADSKDLDDAVSLVKTANGWDLGVHIADVSNYVTHGTPLDQEAFQRGTSVYYANSVVPMLPEELSNGICSLNPAEDRLAFSAILKVDSEGNLTDYSFHKTVIRSRVKGVYAEVNAILGGTADAELLEKYNGLTDVIAEMGTLAKLLQKTRYARGGIDFETTESKVIIGADGKAADIVRRERGESEKIIEEFMLCANEAAATLALEKALPFIFRVHENPSPDKLEKLYAVLAELGIPFHRPKNGVTKASQLSDILEKASGTEKAPIVSTMMLRSMAKAKYSAQNIGHFGLALKNYAHFTSPIRRYPDLSIHRILSAYLAGVKLETLQKRFGNFITEASTRSTEREIGAMTSERDCESCYKAEYMLRFVGEEFDGVITSVVAFGVYVQLANTVEGLMSIRNLPGDWDFDGSLTMTSRIGGKKLRLGDKVRVKVLGADVSAGNVDFGPAAGE